MQLNDELAQLYDKLNLTGRVIRLGVHPAKHGGCANIFEGLLIVRSQSRAGAGAGSDGEGQKVAVKVIRDIGTSASIVSLRKRLVREVRAWSMLHHRNVLTLHGFTYGFDPQNQLASLVSPWMSKGTARVYLEFCNVSERIRVLTGVADGLCYLHRHDVIHGDLKGDNILIDEHLEPRLADFGLSKLITEASGASTVTDTVTLLGSVRWMARELFNSPGVTCESDIWAFGMTILELFTSQVPFHYLTYNPQVIVHVHSGVLPERPEPRTGIDDQLWDLCTACWTEDPRLRPSMSVLRKRLWDLDLKCKLRSRSKRSRRNSDSPEPANGDGSRSRSSSSPEAERRLHKSPKLSTSAGLPDELARSPGSPWHTSHVLVRTPTPRSVSMSGSSPSGGILPSRSGSHRSSRNDLTEELDPRRLFTDMPSEGDVYTNIYNSHAQRARTPRTYAEPAAQNTFAQQQEHAIEPSALRRNGDGLADINALGFDPSVALVSPRHINFNLGNTSPRHATLPLDYDQRPRNNYHSHPHIGNGNEVPSTDLNYIPQHSYAHDALHLPHPSQWAYLYPPYTHESLSSSSALELQPGSLYYNDVLALQARCRSSSDSSFLNPSSTMDNADPLLVYPPQELVLSPRDIGPLFSEAFISDHLYDEPQPSSPIMQGGSVSYANPPHFDPIYTHSRPQPTVDFSSLQFGVISPALSDASVPDTEAHTAGPSPRMESPVIGDYDAFDAVPFDEGLSLFGGFGVADPTLIPKSMRRQTQTRTRTAHRAVARYS